VSDYRLEPLVFFGYHPWTWQLIIGCRYRRIRIVCIIVSYDLLYSS
jgi:hypothetical protein